MCRFFGYRGSTTSSVRRALVDEENALARQSREHPDGWGLAWYEDGTPVAERSIDCAHVDTAFHDMAARVSSDTVIAHVRKASVGALALENTHPFVHGPWVLAHNGTVPDFESIRADVENAIDPIFRASLVGETDSERLFGLFLTHLSAKVDLTSVDVPLEAVFEAIGDTVRKVFSLTAGSEKEPSLNLLVTNGRLLAACRNGRTLHFSTHSSRCLENSDGVVCLGDREARVGERVDHLLVASEKIGAEHAWTALADGELVGLDGASRLVRAHIRFDTDAVRRAVA